MNKQSTNFPNLKDSLDLRNFKNKKKTQFTLQPKKSLHASSTSLLLNMNLSDKTGVTNPMIDTPRFQPSQEPLLKKIADLEKDIYEKERNTFNRISEMQKQINWLTSTVYNLIESNENATQAENEKSQKIADEFKHMTSPPGLPIPKSKMFEADLKMMQTPEPSPSSKNSDFLLIDAEINMINNTNKMDKPKNLNRNISRNVITPINECFTPDSSNSPFISCSQNTILNKSR